MKKAMYEHNKTSTHWPGMVYPVKDKAVSPKDISQVSIEQRNMIVGIA